MKAYQIKIELIDSNPLLWRRVIILADVTFKRLYDTIKFLLFHGNPSMKANLMVK